MRERYELNQQIIYSYTCFYLPWCVRRNHSLFLWVHGNNSSNRVALLPAYDCCTADNERTVRKNCLFLAESFSRCQNAEQHAQATTEYTRMTSRRKRSITSRSCGGGSSSAFVRLGFDVLYPRCSSSVLLHQLQQYNRYLLCVSVLALHTNNGST